TALQRMAHASLEDERRRDSDERPPDEGGQQHDQRLALIAVERGDEERDAERGHEGNGQRGKHLAKAAKNEGIASGQGGGADRDNGAGEQEQYRRDGGDPPHTLAAA